MTKLLKQSLIFLSLSLSLMLPSLSAKAAPPPNCAMVETNCLGKAEAFVLHCYNETGDFGACADAGNFVYSQCVMGAGCPLNQ